MGCYKRVSMIKETNMTSKLDLRLEAAKIVAQLPGTEIDNFHERAYRVELYLTGDAELPEQDSTFEDLKRMMGEVKDLMKKSDERPSATEMLERAPGLCMGLANTDAVNAVIKEGTPCYHSSHGIPSSEGEALFLQRDGEKVE